MSLDNKNLQTAAQQSDTSALLMIFGSEILLTDGMHLCIRITNILKESVDHRLPIPLLVHVNVHVP